MVNGHKVTTEKNVRPEKRRSVYDSRSPAPANGKNSGERHGNPRNNATLERHNADATARPRAKAAFLTRYREGWSVRRCAEAAGTERTTVWRWRQVDQEFDGLYRAAREDGTDIFRDLANEKAREGNVAAIALVLKMRGAFPGDLNWEGGGEEAAVGAAFTVEDLAQRAIDRGYVSTPKPLREIDGADIAKGGVIKLQRSTGCE